MLSDFNPVPTLAVKDLDAARSFYEGTLGFTRSEGDVPDVVLYSVGSGKVMVYASSYAGTNKATAVSFQVPADGFDAEVSALREKGVTFLTFDMPSGSWDDGVLSDGSMKSVWFEDLDGNILNVGTYA
ncbi:VOC family protein [Georgenia yuyongxinii]|uniref:VOC family protein n=1 Tax=Georgenia yuyongxinii TaxID=2589797 RepID=A0A552WPS7_9MICO|nr:VOC family protein [Georgenia yuyongxinii]TRW44792.1 VOC family protein [Georgenia yuyongxinii]